MSALLSGSVQAAVVERPRLVVESEDGKSSMRLQLSMQLRLDLRQVDPASEPEEAVELTPMVRRLRPVVSGSVLDPALTYQLHVNLVPGAAELMDLWLDYAFSPTVRARLGQVKVPFTRRRINSCFDLPLVEWSLPTRYFGAERQLGVTLHNGMGRRSGWEYEAGIYTGENRRAANGIGLPLAYGVKPPNRSLLVDPAASGPMHPELIAHAAYNAGGMDVSRPSDLEGGPLRVSAGMSVAWDAEPEVRQDARLRLAPEVMVKAHGFGGTAVFFFSLFDEAAGDASYEPGLAGGLVEGSYLFAERYEVALRYTTVHLLSPLRHDARVDADARVAAVDLARRAATAEGLAYVGTMLAEHEATLGLTVYVMGTALKWQSDLGLLLHQIQGDNRYDLLARTQLQLVF
jgi:hypothetical protein